MTDERRHHPPCTRPEPETVAVERSVFFDGKFMSAADFALDPHYLLDRHRLHNEMYHGWGVSNGLEVRPHPDAECRSEWVVIEPGLAVDIHGRELVVRRQMAVRVFGVEAGEESRPAQSTVLSLEYHQVGVDPVPVLCDDGTGKTVRDGRVREEPRPVVQHGVPDRPWWPFEPPRVPLARLRRAPDGRITISMFGRPDLEKCPARIVDTSWVHGATRTDTSAPSGSPLSPGSVGGSGERGARRVRAEDGGWERAKEERHTHDRLVITFDRDLARDSGVDAYTFVVEAGQPQGTRRHLRGQVRTEGPCAIFEIESRDRPVGGESVFISLNCDYVIDHRGYRVASAPPHVPRNNPAPPGGRFESWFQTSGTATGERPDASRGMVRSYEAPAPRESFPETRFFGDTSFGDEGSDWTS